jgi:AraC-like DNA-binding protein
MIRLTHVPGPPLSQFVHFLWLYEGYTQPHAKERVLPTGEMQIVINLLDDRTCIYERDDIERCQVFRGSVLSGAHSEYQVITTAMQASVIGVAFKPGGAFPFLRMPAGELRDTTVALETLWGGVAANLRDRLLEAPTHRDRFRILEHALLSEFARGFDQHPAVDFAVCRFMDQPHVATVAGVANEIGLNPKRFIQVFRDQTGFTPKVFCRIRRFQQALDRIAGVRTVDWANVALDCGYFDQAHFIHDFRAFSGINPTTYLAHQTPHRNHVLLPD